MALRTALLIHMVLSYHFSHVKYIDAFVVEAFVLFSFAMQHYHVSIMNLSNTQSPSRLNSL